MKSRKCELTSWCRVCWSPVIQNFEMPFVLSQSNHSRSVALGGELWPEIRLWGGKDRWCSHLQRSGAHLQWWEWSHFVLLFWLQIWRKNRCVWARSSGLGERGEWQRLPWNSFPRCLVFSWNFRRKELGCWWCWTYWESFWGHLVLWLNPGNKHLTPSKVSRSPKCGYSKYCLRKSCNSWGP